MKVSRKEFEKALRLVKPLCPKTYTPGLVRLEATDGHLVVSSLGHNDTAQITIACEGDLTRCELEINPLIKDIHGTVLALKAEPLCEIVREDAAFVVLSTGTAHTRLVDRCVDDVRAALPAEGCDVVGSWTWNADDLGEAIDFVVLAVSYDEAREHLCRLNLEPSRVWAVDGHRAHMYRLASYQAENFGLVSIGAESAKVLSAVANTTCSPGVDCMLFSCGLVQFRTHNMTLTACINTSNAPEIDIIMGYVKTKTEIEVDKRRLQTALKKFKSGTVALSSVQGCLRIRTLEKSVDVPLSVAAGDIPETGINPQYLLESLNGAPVVKLAFGKDGLEPILVTGAQGMAIVMPMRL